MCMHVITHDCARDLQSNYLYHFENIVWIVTLLMAFSRMPIYDLMLPVQKYYFCCCTVFLCVYEVDFVFNYNNCWRFWGNKAKMSRR